MLLNRLFRLILLLLFIPLGTLVAGEVIAGDTFLYENACMKQVLSFKNNTISIKSILDKKSGVELMAENQVPYFEFMINKKKVTSLTPVWRFVRYDKRALVNQGLEYTFHFEGKGAYKGLKIELLRQYFENSTLVREKIHLQSMKGYTFTLNKKDGKLFFVYPQLRLNSGVSTSVREIQMANYMSSNHMFRPAVNHFKLEEKTDLSLKGPFSITQTGRHTVLSTYEHASQDGATGFRLSEIVSKKKTDIDDMQGVKGDDTSLTDDDFCFIKHRYHKDEATQTLATELVRGGYFDQEEIPHDTYYETVWNSFSFIGEKEDIAPLIHHYLFSQITEHPKSRDSHFYYNTWAMQRELQKKGFDLRGAFTEAKITEEIDHAADMHVELFVLDDGWEEALGIWTPHKQRLPQGLSPLVNRMKERGLIPGIWLSPMAIDSISERYKQHPDWIIRRSDGKPILAQWDKPVFDFVGPFSGMFLEDCKYLVDQGIRFFKWDAMNTFNSSLAGLEHGDDKQTRKERIDRYNYLFPFYVTHVMKQLREYNKDVVVEIDLTEPERCMIGLMPLQEGKFYFINNGASAYGDYSTFRAKSMRTVINEYGTLFPKELFTYAVYPHNASPYRAQLYNLYTSLIAGNGIWGDLAQLPAEEKAGIGWLLSKAKQVRPYMQGTNTSYAAKVGASPEIYTQLDSARAFGQVFAFSGSALKYRHTVPVNTMALLAVLNHPYKSGKDRMTLDFEFNRPDDAAGAFLIGNEGEKVTVAFSTGRLKDAKLENGLLQIEVASKAMLEIRYADKKMVKQEGGKLMAEEPGSVTVEAEGGTTVCIRFENLQDRQGMEVKNWPEEADPRKIGLLVANRFVASPHNSFYPPEPTKFITYPEVCTWYGALRFADVTKNEKLLSRLEERFMPFYGEEKKLLPSPTHVDNNVFGAIPFELYRQTGKEVFLELAFHYADSQWTFPANPIPDRAERYRALTNRGLSWQTRFWIDDMYMISLVQTQAFRITKDRKYIDRTANEMHLYLDTLQQPNGLFFHAPDAQFFWGRGNGWMAAGMSELLSSLPEDNKDRKAIMAAYLKMMENLKRYQRPDGLWGQLIDDPQSWVETSGSAMFTYAFIMGVKNGWLDRAEYAPAAGKAWTALAGYINADGDISDVCEGTNRKNDHQYYLDRKRKVGDMHGQAAVLWCAWALLDE